MGTKAQNCYYITFGLARLSLYGPQCTFTTELGMDSSYHFFVHHISTVSFSDISVLFPLNVHACRPKELLKMQISSTFSNIVIETSLNSDVQNLCPLPGS